jgi:hypothetical protein
LDFSPSTYRCVPVPIGSRFRVAVENFAAWKDSIGEQCKSRVTDLVEPNFYGALTTQCSRRQTGTDERLADDPSFKEPTNATK